MPINEIKHYLKVSEHIASSGQPRDNQFDAIAAADYEVVINLAMPDSTHAIADEQRIVTALRMDYAAIPVPFNAPTVRHLQDFFKAMQEAREHKIWVHCALNYRASAFLYHYHRLVLNQSETEAKKAMLPSWQPNAIWQAFLLITADDVG